MNDNFKLISIDPGTSTIGVAIWDIDKDFKIQDLSSFTIVIDTKIYTERRIKIVNEIVYDIINRHRPLQLVHESGFMDRFRPQAFGPIYATIFMIRQSFKDLYKYTDDHGIFMYSPKNVKATVDTGEADKFDMLRAVSTIVEIKPFLTGVETEHAIDAIAIGYTHLKNIRECNELLLL